MTELERFLLVSSVIFCIGLYGALARRNVVTVLMSIELMFNAVNIAAVAFSRYTLPSVFSPVRWATDPAGAVQEVARAALTGQVFALFIIAVAAAEVALALALVIVLYRQRGTIEVTDVNLMSR